MVEGKESKRRHAVTTVNAWVKRASKARTVRVTTLLGAVNDLRKRRITTAALHETDNEGRQTIHDMLYEYNDTKRGVARCSVALGVEAWYA